MWKKLYIHLPNVLIGISEGLFHCVVVTATAFMKNIGETNLTTKINNEYNN